MKIATRITKGDLKKAGPFTDCFNCLMVTVLRRYKIPVISANPKYIRLEGGILLRTNKRIDSESLTNAEGYKPELVGKRFTFYSS